MPRRTRLARSIAWLWTLGILVACWIPSHQIPDETSAKLALWIPDLDKLIHAMMFAGFGLFWLRTGPITRSRVVLIFTVGAALAIVTELVQGAAPIGREASPFDALADISGLLVGIGIGIFRAFSEDNAMAFHKVNTPADN